MSEKKGGILKYVLGCGCLMVLLALVASAGAAWFVYDQVSSIDWKRATDLSTYSEDIEKKLTETYSVDMEGIGKSLTRPMAEDDVDRFLSAHDWFYDQPESRHTTDLLAGFSDGDLQWSDAVTIYERQGELRALMGRFDAHVEKNGGYLKQTDSAVRAIGTTAALDAVATATGGDTSSDETAQKALEISQKAHEEAKSADPEAIGEFLSKQEVAGFKISKGLANKAKPGVVAISRMPTGSFKSWKNLSTDKRHRLIDAYEKQRKFVIATQINPVLNAAQMISMMQGIQ